MSGYSHNCITTPTHTPLLHILTSGFFYPPLPPHPDLPIPPPLRTTPQSYFACLILSNCSQMTDVNDTNSTDLIDHRGIPDFTVYV